MLPPSEEIGPEWLMRAAHMEMIMLRTTFAAIALTVIAGASFAYAADDSSSENQAIDLEQNKVPAPEGVITTAPAKPGGHDQELKELDDEKTDDAK
jgi:hypothetical protein